MITIPVTPEQVALIQREIRCERHGGWQNVLEALRRGLVRDSAGQWSLTLTVTTARSVVAYSENPSRGGYQDRVRPLLPALRAALAEVPQAETPSLFGEAP